MTDARPDDPTVLQPPSGLYRDDPATSADETVVLPPADGGTAIMPPLTAPDADRLQPAEPLPPDEAPVRKRRLWPLGVVAGLIALLGGTYVAGYFMSGDMVPKNTTAGGVAIGGLSREAAVTKLASEVQGRATAPINVTVEGKKGTVQPAQAGLTVDADKTVAASGVGRSWSPEHIMRVLTGGGPVDLVVASDRAKLEAAVTSYANAIDSKPADATLAYQGIVPTAKPGTTGLTVDVPATADAVRAAYLTSTDVTGKGTVIQPAVTTAEAEEALTSYAKPAVSGPITLDTGKGNITITPEQIAAATTFPAVDGTIKPATDVKALYAGAQPAIKALNLGAAKDATITMGENGPVVTPSVDGVTLTEDEFVKAVTPLITAKERAAKPTLGVLKAGFTTEQANALGVKEVTGEFTTYFPYAAYRNTNLTLAAKGINNSFLKPGETFSLNRTLGERTAANGYVEGYVIVSGALVKELGGGVSQSATTTFNAIFFAGLKDVEHHPHMFYIDRYPPGREATVYYGSLDLRFQNDTQYGVLMQAFVTPATPSKQGSITVKVWSTKVYDKVESSELRKSNFTDPKTIQSKDPKCEPQSSAQGFDVNYERLFYKGGQVVRTEKFYFRYQPEDRIVCVKP